jgi:hypothetical protein
VLRRHRLPIASFALIALLIAQSAAGWHWLKHIGTAGDSTGLPGTHAQLCLECASFAPVNAMHGSPDAPLVVAVDAGDARLAAIVDAPIAARRRHSFRSRAPPR